MHPGVLDSTFQDNCLFDEMPSGQSDLNSSEAGPITADEDFDKSEFIRETGGFESPRKSYMSQSERKKNDEEKEVSNVGKERDCSPGKYATFTRSKQPLATPSPRQEMLAREISKLQDLMIKHEESYEEAIQSRAEEVEALRKRLSELETGGGLGDKLSKAEAEVAKLKKELEESQVCKKQLVMIMEEYEKTIAQVVAKREEEKKEFETVKEAIASERDTALAHLSNMEIAFNDIHQKYERCKAVIDAFRQNEEAYKTSLKENEKTIRQQEENYLRLKAHATEKLEEANAELEKLQSSHLSETARMSAINRKTEIRLKSLEESLEQKKREVDELTKICDDLISKVERK